jgi:sodium/potassium-transporting ATPase subunit alpha
MTFAKEARSGASTSGSLFCLPAVCGADEGIAPVQKPRSSAGRRDKIRSTAKYTEHTMTMGALSDLFGTHINEHDPHLSRGLSASLANNLLLTNGNNTISPPITTPRWMLFMLQFTETFMVLLQFAAFLSLLSYFLQEAPKDPLDLYIGIFLIVVVIFQCASTYWQETKSDELMEKFRALAPQYSLCIREGVQLRLPSTDLVVGDIIRLPMGVKVPADCRLIYISSGSMFRVDQSSITGESEPVDCNCKISSENNAFEAFNLTFSGSLVVEGEALAVIIRSGDHTLLGDMVKLSSGLGREASMLKQDVGEFVWVLSKIAVFMGLMVFLAGIYRGLPVLDTLIDGFIGQVSFN